MSATRLGMAELNAVMRRLLGCDFAEFQARNDLRGGRMPASAFVRKLGKAGVREVVIDRGDVRSKPVQIRWGTGQSYFGECLLAATNQGICSINLQPNAHALVELQAAWPNASFRRDDGFAGELASRVFGRSDKSVTVHMIGTEFQTRVWRALLRIPSGSCISYGELARCIGSPSAARAVGSAVGSNPLALLVPCHRVLPAAGTPGGYRWGTAYKWVLLLREQIACSAAARQAA
jgi:AraC family transcriptional regulator of adaptative response/methylated-DNA-[protein]-cysteine methyltransferase